MIGTNLQEAGVDEPDLVKTDGERIVAVSGNVLHILSIDGDALALEGSIDLGFWTQDLFLDGDRVIAIDGHIADWNGIAPMSQDRMKVHMKSEERGGYDYSDLPTLRIVRSG